MGRSAQCPPVDFGKRERRIVAGHDDVRISDQANPAAKPPGVIRAAKASLNGIDPVDVNRSYRFEQGFTFELNLMGEGDRARDAFVADKDES